MNQPTGTDFRDQTLALLTLQDCLQLASLLASLTPGRSISPQGYNLAAQLKLRLTWLLSQHPQSDLNRLRLLEEGQQLRRGLVNPPAR